MERSARIEKLRLEALNGKVCHDEFFYRFYSRYGEYDGTVDMGRYADAYVYAMEGMTPFISEGELVVGKSGNGMNEAERAEWNGKYREIARRAHNAAGGGQDSHMAIDYGLLLTEGIKGVVSRIDGYLSECMDDEKREFYGTCKACLGAVVGLSRRYAERAKELAEKADDAVNRKELLEIAEICRRVPEHPAESFREAVQVAHFISYCLSLNPLRIGVQQFQLGRPDRYLYPYFERDIRDGRLDEAQAQEILDCLGIQINNRVCSGLSCGYMVGGRDASGEIVENRLTEMLMQVVDDIR
ncbi:MAG: hypothetical protein IJY04_01595, partial [Clostridia bacterium]|nr:hypothetical protein [Clostridia bacterium]